MVRWFEKAAVFYFLAAAIIVAFPLMALISDHASPARSQAALDTPARERRNLSGVLIVVITTLFFLGNGAAWAMSGQMAQRAGLPLDQLGRLLGLIVAVGTLGLLLAATLGTRYGRLLPLVVSITLNALGIFGMAYVSGAPAYIACLLLFDITFLFIHPYLLGIASDLTRTGKWVVASSSAGMVGFGVAPAIAGVLVSQFGMAGVGWLAVLAAALVLILLLNVLAWLKNTAAATHAA